VRARKLAFSDEQLARFLRSYYVLARQSHPNLKTDKSTGLKGTIIVFPLALGSALRTGRYVDVQHAIVERRMKITISRADLRSVQGILGELAAARGWSVAQNAQRVDLTAAVPNLVIEVPIEDQKPAFEEALSVAESMVAFVRENGDLFRAVPIRGNSPVEDHLGLTSLH
jgi:hypothetical protein